MIHPQSSIHTDAKIGEGVSVGAFSVIGPNVVIGDNCWIGPHVIINGPTKIGTNNRIYQFCSIGDDPQDKKYKGEKESELIIGSNNLIREYCSINRGTKQGGGVTRLGDDNWIMAYVHIAHDCTVGNSTVLANNATLAGHVRIDDFAILGGFTGIHQFCRIGKHSFSAISSIVVKDVAPFLMMSGNTAKPNGLNKEGLKRHGFSQNSIKHLKKAYKVVYCDGLLLKDALKEMEVLEEECSEVNEFMQFIRESERGIAR